MIKGSRLVERIQREGVGKEHKDEIGERQTWERSGGVWRVEGRKIDGE